MNLRIPLMIGLVGQLTAIFVATHGLAANADFAFCGSPQGRACALPPIAVAETASNWRFSRAQGTKEGESFASIMKTADTARSDPDFAGLIVRCAPKGRVDVLIALIAPFPPRSHPQVTVSSDGPPLVFEGSVTAAGAAVLLPDEAGTLAGVKWQTASSLAVSVKDGDREVKGIIALNGFRAAYSGLTSSCAL
jgi:hypothetical protein